MNKETLIKSHCQPCAKGEPALPSDKIQELLKALGTGWVLNVNGQLYKVFPFPDFKSALAFTDEVGALAEAENHHPDILLQWGKVGISLYTHSIQGLSLNDFILASKIDGIKRPGEF
ncbi:MAG: 4A-hydroxytetrahydrobiopterin dehydratase [uncultured bacterium]|nr:MAG: 4A-hydroxytetrahydrobiopterin dehydratase [uncultured bacterium]